MRDPHLGGAFSSVIISGLSVCRTRLCTTAGSTMSAPGCRKSATPGGLELWPLTPLAAWSGFTTHKVRSCWSLAFWNILGHLALGGLERDAPSAWAVGPVPLLGQRTHSVTASYHIALCPSGRASKSTISSFHSFRLSMAPLCLQECTVLLCMLLKC